MSETFSEDSVLADPPPMLDPSRRFRLEIRSRMGTPFKFDDLTFTQVLERLEWAEPYGFTYVVFEEVTS